jgi:phosphatidylinositol 3-kinase
LQENLAEAKHQKLTRSLRTGLSDRDLKPNSFIRDALQKITQYPPTQKLTFEEQDLVWRYRFYLTANKKVRNAPVTITVSLVIVILNFIFPQRFC